MMETLMTEEETHQVETKQEQPTEKMKWISVGITESVLQDLDLIASDRNLSRSSLVRTVVLDFITNQTKEVDEAVESHSTSSDAIVVGGSPETLKDSKKGKKMKKGKKKTADKPPKGEAKKTKGKKGDKKKGAKRKGKKGK